MDLLLRYVQEDAADRILAAAANLTTTLELLSAAQEMVVPTGGPAAALLAAIETTTSVRDALRGHAAHLATACRPSLVEPTVRTAERASSQANV